MIQLFRLFMAGVLTGAIVSAVVVTVLVAHLSDSSRKSDPERIGIRPVSGSPAKISGVSYSDDSAHIGIDSTGTGSSVVDVPYRAIPPANDWITKRDSVFVYYSARGCLSPVYSHRWDSFALSGGARIPVRKIRSVRDYDIFAGVGINF